MFFRKQLFNSEKIKRDFQSCQQELIVSPIVLQDDNNKTFGNALRHVESNIETNHWVEVESDEDRILTSSMGGELGSVIVRLQGMSYNCIGTLSAHVEQVGTWHGYPHSHGLSDSKGRKWWPYQICSKSGYQIAWWKVSKLVINSQKLTKETNQGTKNSKARGKDNCTISNDIEKYRKILAVRPDSSVDEIKRNYRYLVRRFHPDLRLADQGIASDLMKIINEAYLRLLENDKGGS